MIVDGIALAQTVEQRTLSALKRQDMPLRLRVLVCAPTFATRRFLTLKEACAQRLGVALSVTELAADSTTDAVVEAIGRAVAEADGVIVQLPFPPQIDLSRVLAVLPASHDVDAIGTEAERLFAGGTSPVLPPVIGAIAEIVTRYDVEITGKKVVIVGEGRLVGAPAAVWFRRQGADVMTFNRKTDCLARFVREADILVLGAGVPGLITPDMVREGVVIFDAGSSEDAGKLAGDADPACAEKAALFTPVPGGIGPITVALIFRNLLALFKNQAK